MPQEIVAKLSKIIEKATKEPDFIKIAQDTFLYTVDYRSPEEVRAFVTKFDKEFGPILAEMNK